MSEADDHEARMEALAAEQRAKVAARSIRHKGLLLVNTGNGKGKSTAGFGLALRAAGHGYRVGLVQFIKGNWKTGEQEAIKRFPEIEHVVAGRGFTWETRDRAVDVAAAEQGWSAVVRMIEAARADPDAYRLLVLDELNVALRYDHLPIERVVASLAARPEHLHVVVTGRDAKPELLAIADTVTRMEPERHAFEAGVRAQRGIEF